MPALLRQLAADESGFLISAELTLIVTVLVLGMIVGLNSVQSAVVGEFRDIAHGFNCLNQSFAFTGFHSCWKWWGPLAWTSGSAFYNYRQIYCDVAGPALAGPIGPAYLGSDIVGGPIPEAAPCPTPLPAPCPDCPPGGVCPRQPDPPLGPAPQNIPTI